MPQWKIFTLTGLSETVFVPAVDLGALSGNTPQFALYADDSASITATNGVVSAWGAAAQASAPSRPTTEADTHTGGAIVRFDTSTSLVVPSGTLDFMHRAAATLALVWRQRAYATNLANYKLIDTTNGGTTAGFQILIRDALVDSAGHQIVARVFNGSTWLVDFTGHGPAGFYNSLLWSVAVFTYTSTSLTIYVDGFVVLSVTFGAITFPSASASSAVIGNCQVDLRAVVAYSKAYSLAEAQALTATLTARFALVPTVCLWGNGANYFADVAGATLSDNTFMALCYHASSGGVNDGVIEARYSPDGVTWTPSPGDGSNTGQVLPFTAPGGGGLLDPVVTQLSNGQVMVVANQSNITNIRTLVAASPAAARAGTWTGEVRVTHGYAAIELTAGAVFEDPSNAGTCYLPLYTQSTTEKWRARLYKTTNYGADGWPTDILVANGVADNINYAEPGGCFVSSAVAAKQTDLATGSVLILVRDDVGNTMWEFTAATAAGPYTRRATNLVAFSAARFQQLADGTFIAILRDALAQYNCLYRRIGVGGGVANYSPSFPGASTAVAIPALSGQYGNICKEVTAGTPLIITANRYTGARCDTYAHFFPIWQTYGAMPIVVSPSTVAGTKVPGDTVQFTARGAGNYVWSLPTNGSTGSIGSSSGLYTAGNVSGTDVVRCTDLNAYFDTTKDVSITVVSSVQLPTAIDNANLTLWLRTTTLGTNGSNIATWTSSDAGAHAFVHSGAPVVATVGGKKYASLDGANDFFTDSVATLATYVTNGVGWVIGWVAKDTGSGADSGLYFFNPQTFADTGGFFGLGTTTSTVFAGQDGGGTRYDARAQTGSTLHYYVAKYDPGAGKIYLSVDGGAFDAGTSVNAIGTLTGTLVMGKSVLNGSFFKGLLGDFVIFKALESGGNITALQAYLASTM